jgi:hypothetical protein
LQICVKYDFNISNFVDFLHDCENEEIIVKFVSKMRENKIRIQFFDEVISWKNIGVFANKIEGFQNIVQHNVKSKFCQENPSQVF